MYESFYGFKEKPFDLLPDPAFHYMSQSHAEVYTHLKYAILENKGFVVITGEVGCGKTTLINFLLRQIKSDIEVGLITNPSVSAGQFVRMMCREFNLPVDGYGKAESLIVFNDFLLDQFTQGKQVALIIDEAQNLFPKTLEEIRMLSNLETEKQSLLQIILVGQPELKNKLLRTDLRQFAQRVSVHCHLDRLAQEEVWHYIDYRLKIAGLERSDLFTPEAVEAVSEYSRGIPRIINILCDTALVLGFSDEASVIDQKIIEDVITTRKEGGIFADIVRTKKKSTSMTPKRNGYSRELEKRLRGMTDSMERIEAILTRIESGINKLTDR
jgi:general secretion pathway protein A